MTSDAPKLLLVIDQDPAVCDLAAAALGRGWAVLGARSPDVAMKFVAKRTFSAVVVDASLPEGQAMLVARRARDIQPHAALIFIGDAASEGLCRAQRVIGTVVPAPVQPAVLRAAILAATKDQVLPEGVEELRMQTTRGVALASSAGGRRDRS